MQTYSTCRQCLLYIIMLVIGSIEMRREILQTTQMKQTKDLAYHTLVYLDWIEHVNMWGQNDHKNGEQISQNHTGGPSE